MTETKPTQGPFRQSPALRTRVLGTRNDGHRSDFVCSCDSHGDTNEDLANAENIARALNQLAVQQRIALDIAKWFVNGDKPDEAKLCEWAEALDRNAVGKAFDWRKSLAA